jgi:hypothetical protein
MLGFLSAACNGTAALTSAAVAISSDKPLWIKFRFTLVSVVIWFLVLAGMIELNGDS